MPGRAPKPSLVPGPNNPAGVFQYLRFSGPLAERNGVVRLVEHLTAQGIAPRDIAVLMRSDYNSAWSGPVRDALTVADIAATDVEAALVPLEEDASRQLMAVARLVANVNDGLAWWTLMDLTSGISKT